MVDRIEGASGERDEYEIVYHRPSKVELGGTVSDVRGEKKHPLTFCRRKTLLDMPRTSDILSSGSLVCNRTKDALASVTCEPCAKATLEVDTRQKPELGTVRNWHTRHRQQPQQQSR